MVNSATSVDARRVPAVLPTLELAQWLWPGIVGAAGALMPVVVYITVVGLEQRWPHALAMALAEWYYVAAIAVGFGTQAGLFVRLRRGRKGAARASTALSGAGTGSSTAALLVNCAPHLTNMLPLIGLSGAAVFLMDYRVPFMLLGIVANVVGVIVMLRLLRKQSSAACGAGSL